MRAKHPKLTSAQVSVTGTRIVATNVAPSFNYGPSAKSESARESAAVKSSRRPARRDIQPGGVERGDTRSPSEMAGWWIIEPPPEPESDPTPGSDPPPGSGPPPEAGPVPAPHSSGRTVTAHYPGSRRRKGADAKEAEVPADSLAMPPVTVDSKGEVNRRHPRQPVYWLKAKGPPLWELPSVDIPFGIHPDDALPGTISGRSR